MKQSIEGRMTIRCAGPAYNPCGREFTISAYVKKYDRMEYNPLLSLEDGWSWIDSQIRCPLCGQEYLNKRIPQYDSKWLDSFFPEKKS